MCNPRIVSALLGASLLSGARAAAGGELELAGALQATTSAWAGDTGGGGTLDATWWFRPWLGAGFVGKEHYAPVDERLSTYLALGLATRRLVGPVRITGELGLVHQHEEPLTAIDHQPLQSLLGVGDGIRHRAGGRLGLVVAVPLRRHRHGDFYGALVVDATWLGDDRGPGWYSSAGLALGFTYDLAR